MVTGLDFVSLVVQEFEQMRVSMEPILYQAGQPSLLYTCVANDAMFEFLELLVSRDECSKRCLCAVQAWTSFTTVNTLQVL